MRRKSWLLTGCLAASAVAYLVLNTDWIRPPEIVITITARPGRGTSDTSGAMRVVFGLDRDYPVSTARVIAMPASPGAKEIEVWNLRRNAGSPVIRGFPYAGTVEGFSSSPPNPDPLIPGLKYRIEVDAGRFRGQKEFEARAD